MSEYTWMSIEIGGDLPENILGELLNTIESEMNNIEGEFEKDVLISDTLNRVWTGFSNYGECDNIKSFCGEHKLSYIHHSEAVPGSGDAVLCWWVPGIRMKQETRIITNNDGSPVVSIHEMKPLINFLLAYCKDGEKILPLFIKDKEINDIVEKGLKNPKKILPTLEVRFKMMMPDIPEIPPLRIIRRIV